MRRFLHEQNDHAEKSANDSAMELASKRGQLEAIKLMVSSNKNIRSRRNNSLIIASNFGHLEIVKYLVSNGADFVSKGRRACASAVKNGHLEIVKYFVSIGVNATGCDNSGAMSAAENGHLEVLKYLLSISKQIPDHQRIIKRAIDGKKESIIKYFVSMGEYHKLLDPYNYIEILDHRHLQFITDKCIHRIFIARDNRKRVLFETTITRDYCDVIIIT